MTMRERPRGSRRAGPLPTRHGTLRSGHPLLTLLKILGISLAVVAVASASVAGVAVWDVTSNIKPGIHLAALPGQKPGPAPTLGAIEGGVNLLLAGTDTRTGQGSAFSSKADLAGSSGAGSNDVTMLLHISADHKSATVVSFPRDLMVPVPSCPRPSGGSYPAVSRAMFNSTLSRGGLSCVVLTVEKMTGLQIPYAAMISFDGVIAMSDAVGGVSVCVATALVDPYTGLNLPAGTQNIVGSTALAFLRTRHGVADGSDLGRISNQQVFMSALVRKVSSGGVLANPIQLYSLAKAATSSMQLSDTLTNPSTMVEIALALKNIGLGNMVFLQYPTVSDPADPNRVVPITSAATVLNAALVADQPIQLGGQIGRAAVADPNAVAPPVATPTVPATGSPTTTGTPTTPPAASVVLPSTITGQTAAQQTCSKGSH
ncbi:MAG: LytR family transcriptional regulator [Microbacteriaceae bacterium]|jgi:LCP family protein required for cell wall assembly|nr:LytR family transcriptional regulator [Microbacteriaceae bacterium]